MMRAVAETVPAEKQADRYDFGVGLQRCLICRKVVLNRGCKECSSRFCGPCYSDHTCTPASSSQEASEVSDTVEEPSPIEAKLNTSAEEPKVEEIVAEERDESLEEEGDAYPEIVYGAPVPERLSGDKMEKKMKKIIKEGGKRGVEIEGAADMGGLQFFCTTMQEPNGDVDLLYESLKAMNAKSDANEEERKGGSGRVGKMLVSADQDNTKVALVAYSPPAKHGELTADQWMKDMVASLGGGEILFSDVSTAKVEIKNDADKGLFVLKLKDQAITDSINYLKSKGLFPDNKDDDDSDYVFGDDDFPTAEDPEIAEEEDANEEKDAVVEEAADFGDDPLAMLGGMGEEEVYKVTLMEDQAVEADEKAEGANEEKDEVVEEAADFGDDPLAMLGGMGEEEVYKVTLMADQAVEADEKAEGANEEKDEVVEEAADFGDDPLAMLGGMGEEEVYKVTLMEDQAVETDEKAEGANQEKDEVVEAADFGDDPLAMLGGMGEEEVYKVTLMEDQAVETDEKTEVVEAETKVKDAEVEFHKDSPKEVKAETTSAETPVDTKEEAKTLGARQNKNQKKRR